MTPILAALQRALTWRTETNAPAPAPLPIRIQIPPLPMMVTALLDDVVYGLGTYAADPRIVHITSRHIHLADGCDLKLIPQPETGVLISDGFGYFPARPAPMAWRLYRPDRTTSTFWWPQLVDALADVLGPAQLPTFTPAEEATHG